MARIDDERESPPAPPITDTNLDDAGELDYEPSEPSANSIKEAFSDDEEEGEAGDSDHEQKPRIADPKSRQDSEQRLSSGDEDGQDNKSIGLENEDEFSGPEEGEVDELEEGEVKDESDQESEKGKGVRRAKKTEPEEGEEESDDEGVVGQKRVVNQRPQQKNQSIDDQQRHRRIPITAPILNQAKSQQSESRPEDQGVCKFFLRGQCTWGSFCKFAHSGGGGGGLGVDRPRSPNEADKNRRPPDSIANAQQAIPVPLMTLKAEIPTTPIVSTPTTARAPSPPSESAWERGLKQARERVKRASEQKEIDPDFEHKRLTMPLGPAMAVLDETPSSIVVDSQTPNFRTAPRPLMDFGRSNDRFSDEGQFAASGAALHQQQSAVQEPIARQPYGREPFYDGFAGNRPAYERRQPPAQSISSNRPSRDSDEFGRGQQQQQGAPMANRRGLSQERYYGNERRDLPPPSSPSAVLRDRQIFNRDEYPPAPINLQRPSQEISNPPTSAPYHQRHSTSSSVDYGGGQPTRPEFRGAGGGGGDRDDRRRLEPEPQGWEYRMSPPAYYRDRQPNNPNFGRAQEGDRNNAGRRNFDDGRPFRENDNRRPPAPPQPLQQPIQPPAVDRGVPVDGRIGQQQRYVPPNYHYYRTLQQQQQNKDRHRPPPPSAPTSVDHERKPPPPVADVNRDRSGRERERGPSGRTNYNYHYYNTKERHNQQQGASGRPLPYERPSYTRQDHRGQWRDPWRRSTSPGGRRSGGAGTVGADHDHSSQGRRPTSREDVGRNANSPTGVDDSEKRQRRPSASSSASGSSGSSRSRSSADSGRRPASSLHGGRGESAGRREAAIRKRSAASSRSSEGPSRRPRRSTNSPTDNGRGNRYDRYARTKTSQDRTSSRVGVGRRDSGDVASRAAAKALGDRRSVSPFGDQAPRSYRRSSGGTSGGRSSAASGRSGQQQFKREHRRQATAPTPPPRGASPITTEKQTPPNRPLSPPPPVPFLAAAASQKGNEKRKRAESQQRSDPARKPIKMTIVPKSKVRTNIYEASPEGDGGGGSTAPAFDGADDAVGLDQPALSPADSPTSLGGHGSEDDDGPRQKKSKTAPDSGSGSGGESRGVVSRREELLRQLRAVEHAIDAKRKKDKK